jgi:hypothetical protein
MVLLTDIIFFFGLHPSSNFNIALHFGSRLCFCLHTRIAPNMMDPLDRAILNHWAPHITKFVQIRTRPVTENSSYL